MSSRDDRINVPYFFSVFVFTILFPVVATVMEYFITGSQYTFNNLGKWFIFSAVGLRLFIAGIKQISNPAFTTKQIFNIQSTDSYPIMRELGFANCCFGLIGIISLFILAGELSALSRVVCIMVLLRFFILLKRILGPMNGLH